MLPEVIIIGSMKGGTSSLFSYLNSHPEMVGSRIKETDYFLGRKAFSRGRKWYEGLFDGEGSIAFEASPNYTKRHLFSGVPERIRELVPHAKLIFILRDPISRARSHYVHNYCNGRETREFSDAIRIPDNDYVCTSRYLFQAQAFLDHFEPDQLLFVQSERLKTERSDVMDEVARFIGIEANFDESVLNQEYHVSKGKKRSSRLEFALRPVFKRRYIYPVFRAAMSPLRSSFELPELKEEDKAVLVDEIGPDIEALRSYTSKAFPGWMV